MDTKLIDKIYEMKLPRFRGDPTLCVGGVYDVEEQTILPA